MLGAKVLKISALKETGIDELIEELGIQGTAEQYIILNKCYKEYYQHIIKDVKKAQNVSNEFRNYARAAETKWEKTYKEIIQYLNNTFELDYVLNDKLEIQELEFFSLYQKFYPLV